MNNYLEDSKRWWMLSRRDADTLEELRDYIWSRRRSEAHEPIDLLGIAGAVYAMDGILIREEFGCVIGLSWVQRVSNEDGYGEGSSFDIAISDEGIELSQMVYIGGPAVGDHHSERSAVLTREGNFDHDAVQEWIRGSKRIDGSLMTDIGGLSVGF